jgi:outer membrane protein
MPGRQRWTRRLRYIEVMHQIRLPLTLAALACLQQTSLAQSLGELHEAARRHDAIFLAARAQSESVLAKTGQVTLWPTINATATVSRSVVDPFPTTNVQRLFGTQSASVSATQPLYRPATFASYQQAQLFEQQARMQLTAAEQDLIIRLSQAYFDVLAAKDTLTLVKAQKSANAEQLAAAKRNFEVGTTTITDTHEAQARYDLVSAQEIAAENDLQVKRISLKTIVGLSNAEPVPLKSGVTTPALAPSDMESWVNTSLQNQPAVINADLALQSARYEVDKASAGHKPTLDAVASYGPVRNVGGTGTSASPATTHYYAGSVGVNFNLPLFAGGTLQAKVQETLAVEEQARNQLEAAKRSATQVTQTAWLNVLSGKSQVGALEAAERSSKSALEANQLGYQVGVRINIDVLNSQSQLFQTRRDLAKARYDLLMADLKLRQAAGTLQTADIQALSRSVTP